VKSCVLERGLFVVENCAEEPFGAVAFAVFGAPVAGVGEDERKVEDEVEDEPEDEPRDCGGEEE